MNNLTVVMYHYVRNIKSSRYQGINGLEIELFIEQLEFIKANYNVVTMESVLDAKLGTTTLPGNALLLTFDDGYAEHFTQVYPLLKKYGMQGSFFIPAKVILEHKVLDVNKIHFILSSINDLKEVIEVIKKEIKVNSKGYNLNDYDSYYKEFAVANRFDTKDIIFIKRMLQHALPEKLRNELTDKLFQKYIGLDEVAFSKELYMTKYQLEQLVRDGMHVGCHGYDHYWWNRLDQKNLYQEIYKSKEFLASLGCNMEKWTACYPYGSFSDTVVEELKSQGCSLAFTTEINVVNISEHSQYLFPRLDTNDFPPKSNNYKKYTNFQNHTDACNKVLGVV